ncbi:MAG: valine--tRNA ligase [bacterium]|nr:valine--tRNA ligase [bacterium]
MSEIPQKYDYVKSEAAWGEVWDRKQIYHWDPSRGREESFVVDSPPLTASGSLHLGHVFSFTHQDLLVRYQRMRGMNIAYPMGWDDNGLPTERRVQTVFGVRPNANLPYDPDWKPRRDKGKKDAIEEISRLNFVELCTLLTEEDESTYKALWIKLGLSIDWSMEYASNDTHCRRISQMSFLDLVERGYVYRMLAPTMWDIDFKSAIAQAEAEDREKPGAFHDIRFGIEGGGTFEISTTRPELLGACIAVVAHPDDERYQALFGKKAITPLFHAPVPILPADHADPEKGTGILMVCTFGDLMDVDYWKSSDLPLKQLVGMSGRLLPVSFGEGAFETLDPEKARNAYAEIEGLFVNQARKKIVELLSAEGSGIDGNPALVGKPRAITHPVKFYENGERPLEFVPTRQWFVRLLDHKAELIEQGRKIHWRPDHMRTRYENWVDGLNQDWCISRQRFSGVPFPVWYPIDADGETGFDNPIYAASDQLPVDPMYEVPTGFEEAQRDQPGGFTGDHDVMDTWATSSMTPEIVSHWKLDPERHKSLFPMDVRPQSHEIIRTWAFYTIAKAWMHGEGIPWHNVVISGWILDPDRKKMSKSKGNVVTPEHLFNQYSTDAMRYWAGRARLGADTAFDETVLKVGKRLATKIFNASRFVLMQIDRVQASEQSHGAEAIRSPIDVDLMRKLRELLERATDALDRFEYSIALQSTEEAFWDFCDNYLELVKVRAYAEDDSEERRSAVATLRLALRIFLRLFAPFMPFVTEEVWSWRFAQPGREEFIHTSPWPTVDELAAIEDTRLPNVYSAAVEVSQKIRAAKTQARKSLRWPVERLEVAASDADVEGLRSALGDVLASGGVPEPACTLRIGEAPENERFTVEVTLGAEASEN